MIFSTVAMACGESVMMTQSSKTKKDSPISLRAAAIDSLSSAKGSLNEISKSTPFRPPEFMEKIERAFSVSKITGESEFFHLKRNT